MQRARRNTTSLDSGTEARLHVILEARTLFFAGRAAASRTHRIDCRSKSFGVVKEPRYGIIFINRVRVACRMAHAANPRSGGVMSLSGLDSIHSITSDSSHAILLVLIWRRLGKSPVFSMRQSVTLDKPVISVTVCLLKNLLVMLRPVYRQAVIGLATGRTLQINLSTTKTYGGYSSVCFWGYPNR